MNYDEINYWLSYNSKTGTLRWKNRPSNRVKIGDIAGCLNGFGYRRLKICGERFVAHRLAWLIMTGEWPDHEIDHINQDKDDNRWVNLRAATHSENNINTPLIMANNTSGYRGVSWHSQRSKWLAQIAKNGRHYHLGLFETKEDAYEAYKAAATYLHGIFNPVVDEDLHKPPNAQ